MAKVIYGVLLVGFLGFFTSMMDKWQAGIHRKFAFWTLFGLCWGLMSIGYHVSLGGRVNRWGQRFIEFTAHLSLTLLSCLVIFFIFLRLPLGPESITWVTIMELVLFVSHITAWRMVDI